MQTEGGFALRAGGARPPGDILKTCSKLVRDGAWAVLERAALRGQCGKGNALQLTIRLALGRVTESPFTEEDEVEVRELVNKAFGIEGKDCGASPRQCMRLGIISAMLHKFGDPDWQFVKDLEDGVPLGVDDELPRTPAVFEEKVKWSLVEEVGPHEGERSNFSSVEPHCEEVESLFREEAKEGWMVEMTDQEAIDKFGTGCMSPTWVSWPRRTRSGSFTTLRTACA